MNTESYELAYIVMENGALKIDTGKHVSRSEDCFCENVTIEYHGDTVVVHGYQRGATFHYDSDGFMDVDIRTKEHKFCTKPEDWYEHKSKVPFAKPQKRLKAGSYLSKDFSEIMIVSSNFTIVHHS